MTTGQGQLRTEREGTVLLGQWDLRRLIQSRCQSTRQKSATGQGKQMEIGNRKKNLC